MTATIPSRLEQVTGLADELGQRPTSNQVRRLLGCGREVANRLLAEWDQTRPAPGPTGPATPTHDAGVATAQPIDTTVDQASATGPDPAPTRATSGPIHRGWLVLLALPAFVAVWGGWVGLGGLAGFGPVRLLPGIDDHITVNLAVTLPAGMEVYAVIGLRVWLSTHTTSDRTRRFAAWSSCVALGVGCLGQVAYHVLARPATGAPLFVTVAVACLPVALLGMGAALFHLIGEDHRARNN